MQLASLLKQIDDLQSQISSHGKLDSEVLKKINYKFRLDWNYNSNVMEGNSLTRQETRSVMINNITLQGKPLKDVLEMRGHNDVISSILKIGKGQLNLSEARIKEIHKGIMYEDDPEKKENIGIWKPYNNCLTNYKGEQVDFTPHTEVKEKMHELINWLSAQSEKIKAKDKKALHPAILAFEFHLRYVSIHPFYDGNGRTSRIFMNLILIAFGYPPVIVKLEEKNKYYQYLGDIQGYGGPPDLFYEYMSNLLIRSQQIVLDAIEGKDIEEQDDFEKEVSLFTKSLEEHKDLVRRKKNREVQVALNVEFFMPFISRIDEKLKKLNHLFFDNYYESDSNYSFGLKVNRGYPSNKLSKYVLEEDFKKYDINHVFTEFKREKNPFDVHTLISLNMDSLKYKVNISIGKYDEVHPLFRSISQAMEMKKKDTFEYYDYILYENYYHTIPTEEEVKKLADKVVQDTFNYIQKQAAK